MARHKFRIVFILLLALVATGCSQAVDDFDGRMVTLDRNVQKARNQAILLNIARASYGHPLNFVSLLNVIGSGTSTGVLGIPSVTFGPQNPLAPRTYTIGPNSASQVAVNSFTVNTLQSQEFYQGLLQPLDFKTAQFFISQGFPREMVFYLFIDSLTIRGASKVERVVNDISAPSFPRFSHFVGRALEYGLSFESFGKTGATRLCFDEGLATKPIGNMGPACGSKTPTRGIQNFFQDEALGDVEVDLDIRSTYKIFQYVGKLARDGNGDAISLQSTEMAAGKGFFPILHGKTATSCFADVIYEGDRFCIPLKNNEYGTRVFELLDILVALNNSVTHLPPVDTVRVLQ